MGQIPTNITKIYDLFGNEITSTKTKLIDKDILESLFCEILKNIDTIELVRLLYSKYEAIIDFSKLCNGINTGEKISMLFNPHRYNTPTKKSISIIDAMNHKPHYLSGLARATLWKEGVVKELLYQTLQLGINGVQYVNEFPPYIARNYYIKYNAKYILDPCAGWGGRMIGSASMGSFYHGFEPSTKTYKGLLELGAFLKKFKTGFDFKIENIPFEDAKLTEKYDFALTSPPYYDTEIYTNEITNSCNRYKTFEDWVNQFYIPMIQKVMKHTNKFVLNIGSRTYDLKGILLNTYPTAIELSSSLSGKGGLGKQYNGKESFFLITKK